MGETNRRTLNTYENSVDVYIDRSPQYLEGRLEQWVNAVFAGIPKDAHILEIGSASGRDAAYLEGLGFTNVRRTDATIGFVERLREEGYDAEQLNILIDKIDQNSADVIFANAVLLHFDDAELPIALTNIYGGLKDGGEFYFIVAKRAPGQPRSAWSSNKVGNERYFSRPDSEEWVSYLGDVGFSVEDTVVLVDDSDPDREWYNIATRKLKETAG